MDLNLKINSYIEILDIKLLGRNYRNWSETNIKKFPSIACCGIDCALCPTFYTRGPSKCPGCGGPQFSNRHPSCSILTCCSNNNFETCADCTIFPCKKLKEWDKGDSFVTHKVCLINLNEIKINGLEKFLAQQGMRSHILKELLDSFNEGRSKSYFCIASTLIPFEDLGKCIDVVKDEIKEKNIDFYDVKFKSKLMREAINQIAIKKKINLKLRK